MFMDATDNSAKKKSSEPGKRGPAQAEERDRLRRYYRENGISEIDAAFRTFMAREFHQRPALRKAKIAPLLEEIVGEPVSLARLDSFTATTKSSSKFPAYLLPGLCEVLGSDAILLFLATPRIRKLVEFAEREIAASHEERERQRLRDELSKLGDHDA